MVHGFTSARGETFQEVSPTQREVSCPRNRTAPWKRQKTRQGEEFQEIARIR